jgi:hypothetical protein
MKTRIIVLLVPGIVFIALAGRAAQARTLAEDRAIIADLDPKIQKAGNDPRSQQWVEVACKQLIEADSALLANDQKNGGGYLPPLAMSRCKARPQLQ